MPRQNVDQNDALIADVLGFSGRDLMVARLTRLVLHGKHSFPVPRPRLFHQRGGTFLSEAEASAASAKTQVLRQVDRDACV